MQNLKIKYIDWIKKMINWILHYYLKIHNYKMLIEDYKKNWKIIINIKRIKKLLIDYNMDYKKLLKLIFNILNKQA